MKFSRLSTAAVTVVVAAVLAPLPAHAGEPQASYIVQLKALPAAVYEGGLTGLPKTAAEPGKRIDRRNADVQHYVKHLAGLGDQVLRHVPGAKKDYDYSYTFPGFSARMTSKQARRVGGLPEVARVSRSAKVYPATVSTPDYLDMRGAGGVWQQKFGGGDNAGLGMIVGVIDTGIYIEGNASFAPLSSPRPDQSVINAKWSGTCQSGAAPAVVCNNKVIGAQWFRADAAGLPAAELSARDLSGHGSHVAGTAAGNLNVAVTNLGQNLGTAAGMAPAARIAVYKALFSDGGTDEDVIAAVDRAVADGVDVINMSLSGQETEVGSPVGVATYFAAKANVFVAMAAGNDGPGISTVRNAKPWVITVAAGTHPRADRATLTLGNGASYQGASVSAALASKPIRRASKVGGPNNDCAPNALNPALATGKIVICDSVDPPAQAAEVKRAGGVGMVMQDATGTKNPITVIGMIPVISIRAAEFGPIASYVDSHLNTATASFSAWTRTTITAPTIASYSSTGPDPISKGDLLKPDITAPGSDIIAAYSPPAAGGEQWASLIGTSMATPHIAGIAALIMAQHPYWTPAMIQSAMMTTAAQTDTAGNLIRRDNGDAANPFHKGSGMIQPGSAFDPGLVYQPSANGWRNFVCAVGEPAPDGQPCAANPGDPSNLNYPSIAIGALSGSQTVTRRVTNVGLLPGTYTANMQAPPGYTASVDTPLLVVLPGGNATFTVTITRTSAPLGVYRFGALTWTDLLGHSVRSPIAVRAV